MSALSAAELSSIRADIEELLPDKGTIMAVTRAYDGAGGWVDTWTASGAAVKCRIDAYRGKEVDTAGAIQPYNQYILSMPHNTTVTTANRFRQGTIDYNILSVNSGSWLGVKRCLLEVVNA